VADAQASLKANAEADAKASVDKAYEAIGKIESALSLLGSVEIDDTGTIIDIDFDGTVGSGAVGGSDDGESTTDNGGTTSGGGINVGGGLTVCPMDAKMCPDGSSVGRQGPRCEFAPCPL
jgi:hypothetical protein